MTVRPLAATMAHIVNSSTHQFVVKPHGRPRDGFDYVVALLAAVPTLGQLYGAPGLLVYILTGSMTLSLIGAALGGALLVLFVVPLFTVRQLTIDAEGIYFQRVLGSPKTLRWSQIRRITPATRAEVVLWGWLLPPFPSRESTRCMSTRDQFRIDWGRRSCYFPPHDPAEFVRIVRRWFPIDNDSPAAAEETDSTPENVALPTAVETGNPYQPPQTMS